MPSREIIRVAASAIGLVSLAGVAYLAGPFVAFGTYRPLETPIIRAVLVVALVAAAAAIAGLGFWRRRRNSAQIAKGITSAAAVESDAEVLAERMRDALATLKATRQRKADFLYDLPWYLLIGPPGAGKTTALVNSGLTFPLSKGAPPAAIAGVGGTRYCDWWFSEDAVLIDTAGRYTTQDSSARADHKSWLAFLALLRKYRPRQPINGVVIAIGLDDIKTGDALRTSAHAGAIRARLLELHRRLGIDFPVYAMFTKADLVLGFREFFADLGEAGRRQVWGATLETADKSMNSVGEVPAELDALIARLYETMTDRLQDEPVASSRVALLGFPARLVALKQPVFDFLTQIFAPSPERAHATLRGFYLTSGTQHGTPIDQLVARMTETFDARQLAPQAYSGRGRSYFLNILLRTVVIGEASWVSTDRTFVRRARIIKAGAVAGLLLACAAASLAWWTSYTRNQAMIDTTIADAADYRAIAGELVTETQISDRDLAKVLPALNKLRSLAGGYAERDRPVALTASLGLSQTERLQATAVRAYATGLERMLRPRLLFRLEERLEADRDTPSLLHDELAAYLMLGGLHDTDRAFLLGWLRRDWETNLYPGAAEASRRKLLEDHVAAMLDLWRGGAPVVTLNGPLVTDTQATLARLGLAERAYMLLRSAAETSGLPGWDARRAGGPDSTAVLAAANGASLETVRVPGFYTRVGFRRALVEPLQGIAERLEATRWILGAAGEQATSEAQHGTLAVDVVDLYARDFIATWRGALDQLTLKQLNADAPRYLVLGAAAAATSPLRKIVESLRDETALTRERTGVGSAAGSAAEKAGPNQSRGKPPGAEITQSFAAYHLLLAGGPGHRPIDAVVDDLAILHHNLATPAEDLSQAEEASKQVETTLADLRTKARRLPEPFGAMLQDAANDLEHDATHALRAQLARALADRVTGPCRQIAADRYPFVTTDREIALHDFGKLFGPLGMLDRFFTSRLARYVDTSGRDWTFRQDSAIGRALAASTGTLKEFQRGARIRETFFRTRGHIPSLSLTIVPPPLPVSTTPAPRGSAAAAPTTTITITMEINGAIVESTAGRPPPVRIAWPGAATNHAAVRVASVVPGQKPATIERAGPWALFRLVEAGAPVPQGAEIIVNYIVRGRTLRYKIGVESGLDPFTLPALREFRCPGDL
jgi:type VI secretion system protein ImpL